MISNPEPSPLIAKVEKRPFFSHFGFESVGHRARLFLQFLCQNDKATTNLAFISSLFSGKNRFWYFRKVQNKQLSENLNSRLVWPFDLAVLTATSSCSRCRGPWIHPSWPQDPPVTVWPSPVLTQKRPTSIMEERKSQRRKWPTLRRRRQSFFSTSGTCTTRGRCSSIPVRRSKFGPTFWTSATPPGMRTSRVNTYAATNPYKVILTDKTLGFITNRSVIENEFQASISPNKML